MDGFEHGPQLGDIEAGRMVDRDAEALARHLAAERRALQVQEPGRALKIGQRIRGRRGQAFELGPGGDLEAHHLQEGDIVALQDPEEGRDVLVDVVDDLGLYRPPAAQEDPSHADKSFGVGIMRDFIDLADDRPGQVSLAALIGGERRQRPNLPGVVDGLHDRTPSNSPRRVRAVAGWP